MRILIVGFGDVATRLAPLLTRRFRVYGLIRDRNKADRLRELGVTPVLGDLDDRRTLARVSGLADCIAHLAPPPPRGLADPRTRHLVAALSAGAGNEYSRSGGSPHCHVVYVSTTGVYGDCGGAWVTECRRARPGNDRGRRRLDAESALRAWAKSAPGLRSVSILRAPGIYAADRLPIARLKAGLPALTPEQDSYSNHIHADDLARAVVAALFRGRNGRVYNTCDDAPLRMGDYFDAVADRFGLARPTRISRQQAERDLPESLLSFMRESRRLDNGRMRRELRLDLAHPTVAGMLAGLTDAAVRGALSAPDDIRPR